MKIKKITAKKILDSRNKPTVEARLETKDGIFFASVPSGTSVGSHEAKTVSPEKAIENIEKIISPSIKDKEFSGAPENQKKFDQILLKLDGTSGKSFLGANAILPVSIAAARALANDSDLTLYNHIRQIYEISGGLPSGESVFAAAVFSHR